MSTKLKLRYENSHISVVEDNTHYIMDCELLTNVGVLDIETKFTKHSFLIEKRLTTYCNIRQAYIHPRNI